MEHRHRYATDAGIIAEGTTRDMDDLHGLFLQIDKAGRDGRATPEEQQVFGEALNGYVPEAMRNTDRPEFTTSFS